jgi:four helix bundle protein
VSKDSKKSKVKTGYRKLIIWNESHKLMLAIYKITENFPGSELFGIISQLRRASLSIPTNIVEGYSGKSKKMFYRYLDIAFRSACEVEYLLEASRELKYLSNENYKILESQRAKTIALLRKFINSI